MIKIVRFRIEINIIWVMIPHYFFLLKQKLPWSSLILLLTSYTTQGYLLHQFYQRPALSLLVWVYILFQLLLLTPITQPLTRFARWCFASDVIRLITLLTLLFFVAVALVWLKILGNFLLVLAAESLARLDLQRAGLNVLQRLAVLGLFLGVGLTLGSMIEAAIAV